MLTDESLLLYLDLNVYSRPFDDQTVDRIHSEADAFLTIVAEAKRGKVRLISSDILQFEANKVLDEEKRRKITGYLELCSSHVHSSEQVLQLGKDLQGSCHTRARDALHIASAILGDARYFLSCDDKVTHKKQANCYRSRAKSHRRDYLSVMNPVLFVENLAKGKF